MEVPLEVVLIFTEEAGSSTGGGTTFFFSSPATGGGVGPVAGGAGGAGVGETAEPEITGLEIAEPVITGPEIGAPDIGETGTDCMGTGPIGMGAALNAVGKAPPIGAAGIPGEVGLCAYSSR